MSQSEALAKRERDAAEIVNTVSSTSSTDGDGKPNSREHAGGIRPALAALGDTTETRQMAAEKVMEKSADKGAKAGGKIEQRPDRNEKPKGGSGRASAEDKAQAVERDRNLGLAVSQIEKQFGKGSIMKLGESRASDQIRVIPTGALSLDLALGIGGIPRGRIIEIYGPESSGKTTLILHLIANAQRAGGLAAFIDAEHALDAVYARKLGVDVDALLVSQPDSGEQALEICEMLVRSGALDIVAIDSVAALVPRAELEGEMGEPQMGLQARLMSQALRKLTGITSKSDTCVIFSNQLRMKIGIMFGNPETTTGGNALKFYSSVRLDIRRVASIKSGESVVGNRTRVKVVKNKVAPPFRQCEFDILYGEGISREGDLIDLGLEAGIIEKAGTWYSFGPDRIGQGRENAKLFMKENPKLTDQLETAVREKVANGGFAGGTTAGGSE
jgi:recombination protein RecA